MPHALYVGSGIVQSRLRDFDVKNDYYHEPPTEDETSSISFYRPSLSAIRSCMKYSIAELCITLFIISIFVNSAILIVAAVSLSEDGAEADLFGMYNLFYTSISPAAATLFALGLLFSGTSAGIVATMAGQMVCEGAMNWRISPFLRRLVTRSISIVPSIIVAAAAGRRGLSAALNGANVALSVVLIFVTAPLVWYTSRDKYMMVRTAVENRGDDAPIGGLESDPGFERQDAANEPEAISLANNWVTTSFGVLIWVVITFMNVATWVLLGMGKVDD
jgi:metal iron transporter